MAAVVMVTASGCQWMAPRTQEAIDVHRVDRKTLEDEYRRLLGYAAGLEAELDQRDKEVAQRTLELQDERESNRLLRAELDATLVDLHYLESQFITLEEQLSQDESKASAVAAMADVQLLYNKFREEQRELLDDDEWEEVDYRLAAGEDAMAGDNFTAAVYHAHRAMRLLNRSERQHQSFLASGTPRVVSVTMANYRRGPGEGYDILGQLPRGTVVVEVSKRDEWSQVKIRSGDAGWIHVSLLR